MTRNDTPPLALWLFNPEHTATIPNYGASELHFNANPLHNPDWPDTLYYSI